MKVKEEDFEEDNDLSHFVGTDSVIVLYFTIVVSSPFHTAIMQYHHIKASHHIASYLRYHAVITALLS